MLYPPKDEAVLIVKERLLEFRERIINGEKFSTRLLFIHRNLFCRKGGELGMAAKQMYWPAFGDAAIVLKPGQVSQIVKPPTVFTSSR